jgi:hypothetical protein
MSRKDGTDSGGVGAADSCERKPCFAPVARMIREIVRSGVLLLDLRDEGGFYD